VLYFNNEEPGDDVKLRLWRSACGMTIDQMDADRAACKAKYTDIMGGDEHRIVLIDSPRISTGMIRRKLRQYNAKLMVFDQLYKIKGFKQHGDDKLGKLQDIFEYARGLAKEHCPVIAVHQADGTSENVQWITMSHLAGSRQAIQGEADFIITVGRTKETPAARYIHTPKNKLQTPGDPGRRNIEAEVWPNFDIARFDE
jgi:replicative DNA helicase